MYYGQYFIKYSKTNTNQAQLINKERRFKKQIENIIGENKDEENPFKIKLINFEGFLGSLEGFMKLYYKIDENDDQELINMLVSYFYPRLTLYQKEFVYEDVYPKVMINV